MSLAQQILSVIMLPGMVLGLIPGLILWSTREVRIGWGLPSLLAWVSIALGLAFIGGGLALMAQTIGLFASRGQGTLAPWDPPQRLVIQGVYRQVRNPMISGVLSVLPGESLLFGSAPLFAWFLVVAGLNALYIPLLEEPQLADRFGDDYRQYQAHVPRWIPRRYRWSPPGAEPEE